MSFDQDPNEQANISAADLAIMVDEMKLLKAQRDGLLEAMRRIMDEPNSTMSNGKALKEIIRIARVAIAKATGGAA